MAGMGPRFFPKLLDLLKGEPLHEVEMMRALGYDPTRQHGTGRIALQGALARLRRLGLVIELKTKPNTWRRATGLQVCSGCQGAGMIQRPEDWGRR